MKRQQNGHVPSACCAPGATFPSATLIQSSAVKSQPHEQLERMAKMFRQNLGRELTPEERKYLGLSSAVAPIDDVGLRDTSANPAEKRRPKAS